MITFPGPSRPLTWLLWAAVLLTAASAASRQLAGAMLLCLWLGAFLHVVARGGMHGFARTASVRAGQAWACGCAVFLLLQGVAVWWWSESWSTQAAGFRLLLTGLAVIVIAGCVELPEAWSRRFGHALAVACASAAACGLLVPSREDLTTNPIPWAAGIAFACCVLTPMAWRAALPRSTRAAWLAAALAGVVAIVLSDSRGVWLVTPWILAGVAWGGWRLYRGLEGAHHRTFALGAVAGLAAVAIAAALAFPQVVTAPAQRVAIGLNEIGPAMQRQAGSTETSVGVRLYLWDMGLQAFRESPWVGIGVDAMRQRVRDDALQHRSLALAKAGHLHNEYLDRMASHGLVGLASLLALGVGLAVAMLRVRGTSRTAFWQLAGLLFVHSVCELSNANLHHKYYDVMLAMSVAITLLCMPRAARPA